MDYRFRTDEQSTPFFPASGPATSSFNGLHLQSEFLAVGATLESLAGRLDELPAKHAYSRAAACLPLMLSTSFLRLIFEPSGSFP